MRLGYVAGSGSYLPPAIRLFIVVGLLGYLLIYALWNSRQ
jgi:hypothetical protein